MTWFSSLHLKFDYVTTSQKTRLCHRLHTGALMVQRPLYPEPESSQDLTVTEAAQGSQAGICHIYLLYPPAGIADGDKLSIEFDLQSQSHAVITTPGAGKWYGQRDSLRHASPDNSAVKAEQNITATVDDQAILEWLPQESIYYNHSVSYACNRFYLKPSASLMTWDISVFGRQAYKEAFNEGSYQNRLEIWRDKSLLVSENTQQYAASRWFRSPIALNNQHVHGSFWAVPSQNILSASKQKNPLLLGQYLDHTISKLRQLIDEYRLPIECTHNFQAINCRYLGTDVRACFEAFYQVRELLRELWYQRQPHRPRIWDT